MSVAAIILSYFIAHHCTFSRSSVIHLKLDDQVDACCIFFLVITAILTLTSISITLHFL